MQGGDRKVIIRRYFSSFGVIFLQVNKDVLTYIQNRYAGAVAA